MSPPPPPAPALQQLTLLIAIVGICLMEVTALQHGIDGQHLTVATLTVAALLGVPVARFLGRR